MAASSYLFVKLWLVKWSRGRLGRRWRTLIGSARRGISTKRVYLLPDYTSDSAAARMSCWRSYSSFPMQQNGQRKLNVLHWRPTTNASQGKSDTVCSKRSSGGLERVVWQRQLLNKHACPQNGGLAATMACR
eukprot:jgi/Chlat1/5189/Chrsp33S05161